MALRSVLLCRSFFGALLDWGIRSSQERKDAPNDFGTHHRLSSSGLVHASKTICAGPLKVRVTTSSRSDFRSTVVPYFVGLIVSVR